MTALDAKEKSARLRAQLEALPSLAVAFSGGADSTFLLASAMEVVKGKVLAMTVTSPVHARREIEHAQMTARLLKAEWRAVEAPVMDADGFRANGRERCYYCKLVLLRRVREAARGEGVEVVAEGTTADELLTCRPGARAVEELGVISPLATAGLTKDDVRFLARLQGVPNFDRPPNSCLATRIPGGEAITPEKLAQVEAAEDALIQLGFRQVRCRLFAGAARIELGAKEIERAATPDVRRALLRELRDLGFSYVVLDLEGYRSGGAAPPPVGP